MTAPKVRKQATYVPLSREQFHGLRRKMLAYLDDARAGSQARYLCDGESDTPGAKTEDVAAGEPVEEQFESTRPPGHIEQGPLLEQAGAVVASGTPAAGAWCAPATAPDACASAIAAAAPLRSL